MKSMRIVAGLVVVFITIPIWYFILYTILSALHVDRLVWFLYWIYIPFGVFVSIVEKFTEKKD